MISALLITRFAHEKKLYEKENAELLGRINQVLSLNETSNQANENMSSIMFEQVLREKHDLETRYHELFNSYLSMLDHNKNLAGKLDERAKSKARSPERSPPARPESAMGRIAKNKLKSQSSKKRSKEKSIERHVISRTTENFPSEVIHQKLF